MGKSFYDWCIENNKQDLLGEWDYEKNILTTPKDIGYGSQKKVWWICEKGHSYDTTTNIRRNGSGCPYCKHQKFKTGYNDLLTKYPEVAKFWNYQKNTLTPDKVLAGGRKKVWWKCEKGHEWESTINSKIADHHCPYCSGRLAIKGQTDLEALFPEIAKEWHFEKNIGKNPSQISAKSSNKVWWKCKKCGYEWTALVSNRTRDDGNTGSGCPQCSNELRISFPEKAIYFYLKQNFENVLENIDKNYFSWLGKMSIDVYIPELKLGVEYDGAWHKMEKDFKKNILCKDNNVTLIRIRDSRLPELNDISIDYVVANRNEADLESAIKFIFDYIHKTYNFSFEINVDINRDRILIYKVMDLQTKENSLVQANSQLALEWNHEKNGGLQPSVVTANSHKKVWWVCKKGHEWIATVASRNRGGNGCPKCANKTSQVNHDSLEIEHPQLLEYWHPTNNLPLLPKDITVGSGKKVCWQCPTCKYEWQKTIYYQLKTDGCPSCNKDKKLRKKVSNILLTEGRIDEKYALLVKEFHSTKNEDITLDEPTLNIYEKKLWWQCSKCHFEWQTTVYKRVKRGQGCPACRGKNAVIVGYNDLLTANPQLANEWHPEKNGDLKPTDVTKGSNKRVWWLCSVCGHEWNIPVKNRNKGSGCPKCARKRSKC
ncbi:zinc-ribbon domain-containing protein [Peribacillus frigoritolerans]|uniref:zinc-ribbon domain-containing protein n=1 Tax=Peribacillus frigoritolerans TaxID=450367 RepID=UPI001F4F5A2A|nr:zinc-ribbon domain-containing protein [Peribacillus frigoritolerans]MCK2017951.1 zinc-ribbon domain-containing protein [Peribacillus frigoritolerans]